MSDTNFPSTTGALQTETLAPTPPRRVRIWPALIIVSLQWIISTVPGWLAPGTMIQFYSMFLGTLVGPIAVLIWWLLGSRLPWSDRVQGLVACAVLGAVAFFLYHPSFELFGLFFFALPVVTTGWVLWLLVTPMLPWPVRRVGLLVVFLLGWGYFTLVRFEGVYGSMSATLPYRWTADSEDKSDKYRASLAGKRGDIPDLDKPLALQPGDWPGFRGATRDGRYTGGRIDTDWVQNPPMQVWRHPIGPGWSSFTVVGKRIYTQEQRRQNEALVCYDANTGTELWAHLDNARFSEKLAGPGPRATPTFHEGKIYALGATGLLNCLDAVTGRTLWPTRNVVADSGAKVPDWGFAASPLVVQDIVTVFAGGPEDKSVLGYHAKTGDLVWTGGSGKLSYCSLQPARLEGVDQLLVATDAGLTAFDPRRGTVLWQNDWPLNGMARIVQPAILNDGDILFGAGFGKGTRRIHVSRANNAWATQEMWTSSAISPYYNDLVIHGGHLYGFDGLFLTCVNLDDGNKKWRARGYGNGQVLLLPDQDLLLVLSETGEVALVEANPTAHKQLGRFQALEGKTWNHPVIAHGRLFVRNGEEAACYQLSKK